MISTGRAAEPAVCGRGMSAARVRASARAEIEAIGEIDRAASLQKKTDVA